MESHKQGTNEGATTGRRRRVLGLVLVFILVGMAGLWLMAARGGDGSAQGLATFTAQRGPLTISVVESGAIKARDQRVIKNEVEGRTSVITLVREGTRVTKGDLLVELDASSLQDSKIDQEIRVQNAHAAYINAQEHLAIVSSQADSDVNEAELVLEFAEQDLRKYEQGQYPKDVNEANKRIALAKEELTRAEEKLAWSEKLFEEKYLSESEKAADEITVRRLRLEVELAEADLKLLQDFTHPRQIRQLQSDVQQAASALDRARRRADSDKRQANADLSAKEAEYTRQQLKQQKIEDQIQKTRILAPCDGLVVYATSTKGGFASLMKEPLAEGQQVVEKQELIYLTAHDTSSMMAEVGIHEASLAKVKAGLPAIVTVDALPGKRFLGRVERVSPLPDSTGMFLNPDLKVFNAEVSLQTADSEIRSGMTCRVEVIVERYDDAVYVPLQAVTRVAGDTVVYTCGDRDVTSRPVEIGLDNNRMIRIVAGLEAGDVVLLDPPLRPSTVDAILPGDQGSVVADGRIDDIDRQIDTQLDMARQAGSGVVSPSGGHGVPSTPQGGAGPAAGSMSRGLPVPNLSPARQEKIQSQMQKAMDMLKDMPDEEKERLKNMSMQEKIKYFQEKMGGDLQK